MSTITNVRLSGNFKLNPTCITYIQKKRETFTLGTEMTCGICKV